MSNKMQPGLLPQNGGQPWSLPWIVQSPATKKIHSPVSVIPILQPP